MPFRFPLSPDPLPPRVMHRALSSYADPFQIIIVCDGFLQAEEEIFYRFCEVLKDEFFKIAPFDFCKTHINLLAYFTPSTKGVIGQSSADTAFGTCIENDTLCCQNDDRLQDVIERIEFKHANTTFNGDRVWLNSRSRSYGAIGVVAKTEEGRSGFWRGDFNYFVFGLKGYDRNRGAISSGGFQYVFVHELGHAINSFTEMPDGQMSSKRTGLADEYEEQIAAYPYEQLGEPLEPNVTAVKTVYTAPNVNVDNLKWRKLASAAELQAMKAPLPNSAVILKEGSRVYVDTSFEYVEPSYSKEKVQLIEGGYLYGGGIFRSNSDCRMRHHMDYRENTTGPEFCEICEHHIIRAITGQENVQIGIPLDVQIKDLIVRKRLMKRLMQSLDHHVNRNGMPEKLPFTGHCGTSTGRMGIMFDQLGIPYKHLRFGIGQGHGFLLYHKLIIDPTFYQLYLNGSDSYEYLYNGDDRAHPIPQGDADPDQNSIHFSNGFVGDFEQLLHHFQTFWPVAAKWTLPGDESDRPQRNPVPMDQPLPNELETPEVQLWTLFELKVREEYDVAGYELAKINKGSQAEPKYEFQLRIPNRDKLPDITNNVAKAIEAEWNRYEEYNRIKKNPPGPYQEEHWDKIEKMYDSLNLSVAFTSRRS